MQIDEGACREKGAPDNLCDHSRGHTQLSGHYNVLPRPDHASDPAQQFTTSHGTIRYRQRIPLGNPPRILSVTCNRNDAMSTEPAVTPDENHVADAHLIGLDSLDHQRFPGPDRRQHAPARRGKTKRAEQAQNVRRHFAPHCASIRHRTLGQTHEAERFCWQLICVGLTLPHVSAEVTKTCS